MKGVTEPTEIDNFLQIFKYYLKQLSGPTPVAINVLQEPFPDSASGIGNSFQPIGCGRENNNGFR
jgi:hypothetical protein